LASVLPDCGSDDCSVACAKAGDVMALATAKAPVARTRLTDMVAPAVIDDDERRIIHGAVGKRGLRCENTAVWMLRCRIV
jgi:hypothetical protein